MGRTYSALMIPGTPLAIAFAQVDDVLIIGTSVEALEACLSPEDAPAAGLHVAEPYRTQRAALPETLISLGYLDLASVAEQGLPMVKAMGAPIPDLEVQWDTLGAMMSADYWQDGTARSTARWDADPNWVIAAGALGAAVLYPVFAKARARAQASACTANLEELAEAALAYADDHDGVLPRADTWVQDLQPYLESAELLKCPRAPDLVIGYAMNRALSGDRLADIRDPENTPLFFESELRGPSPAGGLADIAPPRHGDGNHFAFADGEVAFVTPPHDFATMGEWEAMPPVEDGDVLEGG
jgi:prepilin-type processing-associated H-X9-DG protein